MAKQPKQVDNNGLINATNLLQALSIGNKLLNENNIKKIISSLKINKKSKVYQGILQIPDKLKVIKSNLEQIESFKNINKNPKLELKIDTPEEINETKDKISHIYNALINIEGEVVDFYNKLNTKNYVNFSKKNYQNINRENNDIDHLISQLSNLKLCVTAHEEQLKLENDKIQKLAIQGKSPTGKTNKKLTDAANLLNALTINGKILNEDNIKQIVNSLKIHRNSKVYQGILQVPDKLKAIKSNLEKTTLIKNINKNPKLELKIDTPEEINETKDKISHIYNALLNAIGNGSNTFNNQIEGLIGQLFNLRLSIYAHENQMKIEKIQDRPLPITPRKKHPLSQKQRSQSLSLLTPLKNEKSLANTNPQLSKSDQTLDKTISSLTLSSKASSKKASSKYLPYIPKYSSSPLSSLSSLPSSEYMTPYSPSSTLSSGNLSTSSSTLWSKASSKQSPKPSNMQKHSNHDQLYAYGPLVDDDYRHKAINALDPENEYAYEAEAESASESASESEKYKYRYKKIKTSESASDPKPETKSKTKSKLWSMTLRKKTRPLNKKLQENIYSDLEDTKVTKHDASETKSKTKSKLWSMTLRKKTRPLNKKLQENIYSDLEDTKVTKHDASKASIDNLSTSYAEKIKQQKDKKSNKDINI